MLLNLLVNEKQSHLVFTTSESPDILGIYAMRSGLHCWLITYKIYEDTGEQCRFRSDCSRIRTLITMYSFFSGEACPA